MALLSPLLSNIMLDDLDKELETRQHKFCRYADDCNIYVKTLKAGRRVMNSIRRFLERHLKLRCNEAKSEVDTANRRSFLGFSFFALDKPRVRLSPFSKKDFKSKIKRLTKRSWGISIGKRIKRINTYLTGWMGYFHLARTTSIYREFDSWIRRRLRVCKLKQWKTPETRKRKIKAFGIREELAKQVNSGKGCWSLSNLLPVTMALNNNYWQEKGLITLTERYSKLCQPYEPPYTRPVRTVV